MFLRILKLAVVGAVFAAAGCDGEPYAPESYAKRDKDNVYHNAAFGLTVTAPDAWHVMSFGQSQRAMNASIDLATKGNDELRAAAKASQQNVMQLFSFSKFEPGTKVEFNPSVSGLAENVAAAPSVLSGRDYLVLVKATLSQTNIPTQIDEEFKSRVIGGQTFDRMDTRVTVNGVSSLRSLYAAKHGDHVVVIAQTWNSSADRKTTDAVIDGIKLDW